MTGQQLKQHIRKHGIKQCDLSKIMGVNQSGISLYQRVKNLNEKTEVRIREALIKLGHPYVDEAPESTRNEHSSLLEIERLRQLCEIQKQFIVVQNKPIFHLCGSN